jgi:DNA-binding NarL/FixJ family response regulator
MDPIGIVLVEDHHLVREGLRLVLDHVPGIAVVGEAASAEEAMEVLATRRADVVLLDLGLGDDVGFDVLRTIRARHPDIRVVMLTMHRDPESVRQALKAGAAGYVVKGAHAAELVDAIRAVARGESYLHSSVTSAVIEDSVRGPVDGGVLTDREREILRLLSGGLSAPEVGRRLGISVHTVHRHVANMSAKLGLRGTVPLVRYAIERGIVGSVA